jgi:hypothetical protein
MVRMKSPIAFREWLLIMGIVLLAGAGFLLLEQIPFFNNLFNILGDCMPEEYIS